MFPYDAQLAAAAKVTPESIPGVLEVMHTIDETCSDLDGLKWFNWIYLQVTQAVENRVTAGGFNDSEWLAELDVQFAALYFKSLYAAVTGAPHPGAWRAMFSRRDQTRVARIQFALAGMNAHINHDLPYAIDATCQATNIAPRHGTPQYIDYTAINTTLDALIDAAKKTLNVRLPGDPLPAVSHLEDVIAAWKISDFREVAWRDAEMLWKDPAIAAAVLGGAIGGLTAFAGEALMAPVP
jgi:Family of unknown function (DUF5995)